MKKLLFIALVLIIACNKEEEEEGPEEITKVEYRIESSVDGAMVKYIGSSGQELIDYISSDTVWVHSFDYTTKLDSVGFQVKDYITWIKYKIILNSNAVLDYEGTLPEGGYAGWVPIFYQMPD